MSQLTTFQSLYAEYLSSDDWKDKRARKLRAGSHCERCSSCAWLEVHHLRYRKWYDCRQSDLQVLCRPCHRFMHGLGPDPCQPGLPKTRDRTSSKAYKKKISHYISSARGQVRQQLNAMLQSADAEGRGWLNGLDLHRLTIQDLQRLDAMSIEFCASQDAVFQKAHPHRRKRGERSLLGRATRRLRKRLTGAAPETPQKARAD